MKNTALRAASDSRAQRIGDTTGDPSQRNASHVSELPAMSPAICQPRPATGERGRQHFPDGSVHSGTVNRTSADGVLR